MFMGIACLVRIETKKALASIQDFTKIRRIPVLLLETMDTYAKLSVFLKTLAPLSAGITVDSTIGKRQGEQALLVIPADDRNDVMDVVNELAANSQQMRDWLTENGWIQDL